MVDTDFWEWVLSTEYAMYEAVSGSYITSQSYSNAIN